MNDFEQGLLAHRAGQFPAAIDHYQRFLQSSPNHPQALHMLGVALRKMRQLERALIALEKAVSLNPSQFEFHRSLGNLLVDMNQFPKAAQAFQNALNINPNDAVSMMNLGIIQVTTGQFDKALEHCKKAADLLPGNPVALINLGSALMGFYHFDQAADLFRQVVQINPHIPTAHYNLACCLKEIGLVNPAIDAQLHALSLDPNLRDAYDNLMHMLLFQPVFNRDLFAHIIQNWRRILPQPHPPAKIPATGRPLRVGFVSADFHGHPVGRFFAPLISRLDPHEFFLIAYSDSRLDDDIQKQIRASFAIWRNTRTLNDDVLDQQIRADQVDLLIDLSLHTAGNRLAVFSRKPAPVQATWLGYCSTTGLPAIDFRLTDRLLDPPDSLDPLYAEKSIHLPNAWWCYPPPICPAEIGDKPAAPVFGCLNAAPKINDAVIDAWARILEQTPDSRLILLAQFDASKQFLQEKFIARSINSARIEFIGTQPYPDYLQSHNRYNIALDPFPYNGGTTSCDALYMGVPLVSFPGDRAMSRMGASILHTIGAPELLGKNVEDYIQIAVELANNPEKRRHYHQTLREKMRSSPLMDAETFAKDFSAAIRAMFRSSYFRSLEFRL